MAFPTYPYQGFQPPYFGQPAPDQLAQLRQQQMQPMMQQTVPQPQPQQPDNGGIIWVQGEAGAKAYLVAPGNTVQLWDSEAQTIYLKSADMSGMPSMRILDYTERTSQQRQAVVPQVNLSDFVTRDELTSILSEWTGRPCKCNETKEDTNHE